MTREALLAKHKELCDSARSLMEKKNEDYAGEAGDTPFKNFEMVSVFGVTTTGVAIFARFLDKVSRIATYLRRGKYSVAQETFADSILDGINYLVLLYVWVSQPQPECPTSPPEESAKPGTRTLREAWYAMPRDEEAFVVIPSKQGGGYYISSFDRFRIAILHGTWMQSGACRAHAIKYGWNGIVEE